MTRSTFRSLKAAVLTGTLSMGTSVALAQETEEESWTDDFTVGAYVDAYAALRSDNNNRPLTPPAGVGSPPDYPHAAYVSADGFALASAGLDVAYSGEQFGATISLRVGPAVNRFYFADQGPLGIENITQAYATWKPLKGLTLDLGQFYTLYGAEVFESWRNMNYTRGGLHYLMQPFWHTGLRANYAINDMFAVNAMVVNGVNIAFENNKSPSLGVQLVATPIDELFVAVGYLGALNPRDDGENASLFDNFIDVVATLTLGDFKLVANFDYNDYRLQGVGDRENWWGISAAPGYSFTNWLGAAFRFEYLSDSANALFLMTRPNGMPANDAALTTLTATLDFKPIPNSGAVVLRPEFRYEFASDEYFFDKNNEIDDKFWVVVLGAVVTSM